VALDGDRREANIELAKSISKYDVWLKIGFRSFIRDGKSMIDELKSINQKFKIFLDLKLYDIPNTMGDTAEEIALLGVDMFNIHASSGKEAMGRVMDRLKDFPNRPLVLAVTALTSFGDEEFRAIYGSPIDEKVKKFAKDSFDVGVDGVVCSVFESLEIKRVTSSRFLTLTPGIRPFGESSDDQKRVGNIKMAERESVDFVVVGRPIYRDKNPEKRVAEILSRIEA
jgi:orotidine-5'-phosphate decarboxylase